MKKYILILLLAIPLFSIAQIPDKNGIFTYESVVNVVGVDKSTLYKRALMWYTKTYNSSNNVLQIKDEEEGILVGKGLFKINYYMRDPSIYHTLSVFVKDGRYKYILTDLRYEDVQKSNFSLEDFPKAWFGKQKLYETVNEDIINLLSDLEESMNSEMEFESDDW